LIKENETGIIVPLKDHLSFADAVLKLITDPPRMKKMGELGKERVRRYFTPEKFISEHEEFYREILH
jgi:glycosyltransferase involved in cell wall biosynthesis